MYLYQYSFAGDPQQLLAVWTDVLAQLGKESVFLNIASTSDAGLTVLDVCPTEADFQGWITGDDWRKVKAAFGGPEPVVTPLGRIGSAVARDDVVDVVPAHVH